jgi:hypothetical protein
VCVCVCVCGKWHRRRQKSPALLTSCCLFGFFNNSCSTVCITNYIIILRGSIIFYRHKGSARTHSLPHFRVSPFFSLLDWHEVLKIPIDCREHYFTSYSCHIQSSYFCGRRGRLCNVPPFESSQSMFYFFNKK